MATVRLSQATREKIISWLEDGDRRRFMARRESAYSDWHHIVTPALSYIREHLRRRGKPMSYNFIRSAEHVIVASINGEPIEYPASQRDRIADLRQHGKFIDAPSTNRWVSSSMLVGGLDDQDDNRTVQNGLMHSMSIVQAWAAELYTYDDEFSSVVRTPGEVRPDYAFFSWKRFQDRVHRSGIMPAGCRFDGLDLSGSIGTTRSTASVDAEIPYSQRIMPILSCSLPIPNVPSAKGWDEQSSTVFSDMRAQLQAECEGIDLVGMLLGERAATYLSHCGFEEGMFHYFVDITLPQDKAAWIRDTLQAASEPLIASGLDKSRQEYIHDSFTRKIIDLLPEYSSVNAMVRDVPPLFQLLPSCIQQKLRQEVPKRSKRTPVLSDDEKQELERQAILNNFG
jgi:hypothetical protein